MQERHLLSNAMIGLIFTMLSRNLCEIAMSELISVIIPTYNRCDLLIRALRSVSLQTYKNIEIIVVDDCSTDQTIEKLEAYPDGRLKVYSTPYNMKASAARNIGIENSKGSYIAFLDSDDEFFPEKLAEQHALFCNSNNPRLGIVTCGRIDRFSGNREKKWLPKLRGDLLSNLLARDNIGAGTPLLMVKREVFQRGINFDPDMEAMQDHDFMIQACRFYDVDFVPKYLLYVNHHEGERTYSLQRSIRAHKRQHKKYRKLYQSDQLSFVKSSIDLAEKYYLSGAQDSALSILPKGGVLPRLWWLHFSLARSPYSFMAKILRRILRKLTYER